MSGLEDGDPCVVIDVGTGSNSDAPDLSCKRVRDVVAVEVHGGQHAVLVRSSENLLEHGIRNDVLDSDLSACSRVGHGAPGPAIEFSGSEFILCKLISPVTEASLCELHDVALVNQCHTVLVVLDCMIDSCADDTCRSLLTDWLDADSAGIGESNLVDAHLILKEVDYFVDFITARLPLYTGIDILAVFSEDNHIHRSRILDWAWRSCVPANGANACIEVELLAERHVETANAAAYWSCQWSLNRD